MKTAKIGILLLSKAVNITYLTGVVDIGVHEREVFLIVSQNDLTLFTSPLVAARFDHFSGELITFGQQKLSDCLKLKINPGLKLAAEFDDLSANELIRLETSLNQKFTDASQLVGKLRIIKDAWEVAQLKTAGRITNQAWKILVDEVRPGVTEKYLAKRLTDIMLELGADGTPPGFAPIVATGKHSSIPHHQSSNAKILSEQPLLIDFGCQVNGYLSDCTRTIWIGTKPSQKFLELEKDIKKAYIVGLEAVKRLASPQQVDFLVNDYLKQLGWGQMIHTTGHGLGLEVHEEPSISSRSQQQKLSPGMVVTIEPGVYLPEFGYRHENTILILSGGVKVLT